MRLKYFKNVIVTPLLKKPGLDKDDLSYARPITNLSFVSKALERIVSNQLDQHLAAHYLLSQSQSAYRAHYSTKISLLSLWIYLLLIAVRGYGVVVLLHDISRFCHN